MAGRSSPIAAGVRSVGGRPWAAHQLGAARDHELEDVATKVSAGCSHPHQAAAFVHLIDNVLDGTLQPHHYFLFIELLSGDHDLTDSKPDRKPAPFGYPFIEPTTSPTTCSMKCVNQGPRARRPDRLRRRCCSSCTALSSFHSEPLGSTEDSDDFVDLNFNRTEGFGYAKA